MIRIRSILLAGLILLLASELSGQSKKTIKEKGIKSTTVQEYFIEEGMDEPVIESIEIFNDEGEVVEIKEFNRRGDVRRWEQYAYNEEGDMVEEIFLDERGRVTRTEKTIYRDGLRVEKHFFNERGRLYKKKEYIYEYKE